MTAENGMQTAVELRGARPEDALEMSRLAAELGYPIPSEEMRRRIARIADDPRHCVVVAAGEGARLLGWMHVEHRISIEGGERGELMGLVVDHTARRSGIGRLLVEAAEKWAAARGVRELTVRSNAARELSHPFYRALGYARVKTQHVYTKAIARPGGR